MSDPFESTYNPDALSCIANLSNDEVFTPPEFANQIPDLLPHSIWSNPNAIFLNPASKSGISTRRPLAVLVGSTGRQLGGTWLSWRRGGIIGSCTDDSYIVKNAPKSGTDLTCGPAMASACITIGLKQENRKEPDLKMSKV